MREPRPPESPARSAEGAAVAVAPPTQRKVRRRRRASLPRASQRPPARTKGTGGARATAQSLYRSFFPEACSQHLHRISGFPWPWPPRTHAWRALHPARAFITVCCRCDCAVARSSFSRSTSSSSRFSVISCFSIICDRIFTFFSRSYWQRAENIEKGEEQSGMGRMKSMRVHASQR